MNPLEEFCRIKKFIYKHLKKTQNPEVDDRSKTAHLICLVDQLEVNVFLRNTSQLRAILKFSLYSVEIQAIGPQTVFKRFQVLKRKHGRASHFTVKLIDAGSFKDDYGRVFLKWSSTQPTLSSPGHNAKVVSSGVSIVREKNLIILII